MIPLRDETHSRRFPVLTIVFILLNASIFVFQAFLSSEGFDTYVRTYGLVPSTLLGTASNLDPLKSSIVWPTVFTSMFMHGSVMHLVSNMWFLWIFGDNIEAELRPRRFVLFYLICGTLASLVHVALNPTSEIPLVGASGAIAGVLGAYFLLFPFHRIVTLVPIGIFLTTVRLPAFLFLGVWFLMQLLYSALGGSVAWWAHIGGFVSGAVLVWFFRKRKR